MKKLLITLIFIIALVTIILLLFPNHFSNISKIEYQKYDMVKEEYGEVLLIEDTDTLKQLTESLNKAKYEKNKLYDLETSHDLKATQYDESGESEIIYFWLEFGPESTMYKVENRLGTFKLNKKKAREDLLQIFSR